MATPMDDSDFDDIEDDDGFPVILALWDVLDDIREYCAENDLKIKTVFDIEIEQNEMGGFNEKYNIFAVPDLPAGPEYDKHFKELNRMIKRGLTSALPAEQLGVADLKKMVEDLNNVGPSTSPRPNKKQPEKKVPPKNDGMSFSRLLELGDKDAN